MGQRVQIKPVGVLDRDLGFLCASGDQPRLRLDEHSRQNRIGHFRVARQAAIPERHQNILGRHDGSNRSVQVAGHER